MKQSGDRAVEDLLKRADAAQYLIKHTGRNRVPGKSKADSEEAG